MDRHSQLGALIALALLAAPSGCSSENPGISAPEDSSATGGADSNGTGGQAATATGGRQQPPLIDFGTGGTEECPECGGAAGAVDEYVPACGNGIVDSSVGEQCDDANAEGGDGCTAACDQIEANYVCSTPGEPCVYTVKCGDGLVRGEETCDDGVDAVTGTISSGDGCDELCQIEEGFECPVPGAACRPICGDGLLRGREQCDDGTDAATGAPIAGDGCNEVCKLEDGWVCPPTEACRPTVCGDGVVEGAEQCDDGNLEPYDGCSPSCNLDPRCGTETSATGACSSVCGDGIRLASSGEECDDGNVLAGDGCDAQCRFEPGYQCTTEAEERPDHLEIPIVIRDFKESDTEGGHPDMQMSGIGFNFTVVPGIVEETLGLDRKPVYAATAEEPASHTTGPEAFVQWYQDVPDVNIRFDRFLRLELRGDAYSMDSATDEPWASLEGFFPIDDEGWGNQENTHNYHFTSELRYWFEYRGGEELTFSGDDDVWVFVNGILAVDIGGIHERRVGRVVLDPETGHGQTCVAPRGSDDCDVEGDTDFALTLGHVYEVVVFQAERRLLESNYWLTLSNFLAEKDTCEPLCGDGIVTADEACDLGQAANTGAHGGCNPDCTLAPYCGDGLVDDDAGEECDDGVNISTYGGCAPGCHLGPSCGDGIVQSPFEECDDGENSGSYGRCGQNCHYGPRCGDGVVQPEHEECDDGKSNGDTNCMVNCLLRDVL